MPPLLSPAQGEQSSYEHDHTPLDFEIPTPDSYSSSSPLPDLTEYDNEAIWAEDDNDANDAELRLAEAPRAQADLYTAGYREGVSDTKEKYLQPGFDQGWQVAAEVGLMVGNILGKITGIKATTLSFVKDGREERDEEGNTSGSSEEQGHNIAAKLSQLSSTIESQIAQGKLFAPEHLDTDGKWVFQGPLTNHPLIADWTSQLMHLESQWTNLQKPHKND